MFAEMPSALLFADSRANAQDLAVTLATTSPGDKPFPGDRTLGSAGSRESNPAGWESIWLDLGGEG